MKKRLLSMMLCLTLVMALVPMGVVSANAKVIDRELPESFAEPYIYATSDKQGVYVSIVHPDDMQRFLIYSDNWWGDAQGGTTSDDYYWTEYGDGINFDTDVQIDWRIPGGEWHYTSDWDTESYYDNPIYDDPNIWGDVTATSYTAFYGSYCYNAEEGDIFYPLKGYFNEYSDGWDNYYLFDQTKNVEFRARYRVRIENNYYPVEEQEESTAFIYSDWCEPVSYGAANDAQANIPSTLSKPTLEDLYIADGEGYEGADLIKFRAFTPFEMSYISWLKLDIEEDSVKDVWDKLILIEASLDGENFEQVTNHSVDSEEYYVDIADIWSKFIREEGQGWNDFVWYTQDVYLRARYSFQYEAYNYSGEEVTTDDFKVTSDYSDIVKINTPGVNRYNITMDYINYGASEYATDSFTRTENERIGWINLDPLEGFWVQKVVVNDEVMFDLEDESTYNLLAWYDNGKFDSFEFIGDPEATENMTISVTYGGESPSKHNLTYHIGENSTGKGYANIGGEDLSYDGDVLAINEGEGPVLTVRANSGSVIKSVTLDGNKLNVPKDATEYVYEMSAVDHAMDLVVEFEATSFSVYGSRGGNGTITVTAPDYYEEADEYVNKGDSVTFKMQADEGFEILRVTLDGEEIDLATLGKEGDEKLTSATYTIEDVQKSHHLYVQFSDEETEYVTLTITWNEGGVCNSGKTTEQVVMGGSCGFYIEPQNGYEVARIIDGGEEITNFIGDYYYARNLNADRTVTVEFREIEIPALLGDVNCDGKVNIKDATLIQKAIANLTELTEKGEALADADLNTKINIKDATAIQKHIAGIETGFPIGKPMA